MAGQNEYVDGLFLGDDMVDDGVVVRQKYHILVWFILANAENGLDFSLWADPDHYLRMVKAYDDGEALKASPDDDGMALRGSITMTNVRAGPAVVGVVNCPTMELPLEHLSKLDGKHGDDAK